MAGKGGTGGEGKVEGWRKGEGMRRGGEGKECQGAGVGGGDDAPGTDCSQITVHMVVVLLVKGMWESKPADWPRHVPFVDPNNRRKPNKRILCRMFDHLIKKHVS